MAKVDFRLSDSLLSRRAGDAPDDVDVPASEDGVAKSARAKRTRSGGQPKGRRRGAKATRAAGETSQPADAEQPAGSDTGSTEPPAANRADPEIRVHRLPRPLSVQTSVQLAPFVWDRLADLAREVGGLATANRLLIALLEAEAPGDLSQAAEDLERFLAMPAEQTGLGQHWEERNVRLPLAVRARFDEYKQSLTAAGLGPTNRSHMIAACVLLRGPETADAARELMADVRAGALRRAVSVAETASVA